MAIPQEEQLNPSRVKRLHGIYNMLKSRGDDEGLAEFTEYMKSKDSIIGFDREGNPILEAKKGGAVRMQTGGTTSNTSLLGFGERHEPTMEQATEQAGLATTAAGQPVTPSLPTGTAISGTPKTIQTNELLTQPTDLATSTTAASTAPTRRSCNSSNTSVRPKSFG